MVIIYDFRSRYDSTAGIGFSNLDEYRRLVIEDVIQILKDPNVILEPNGIRFDYKVYTREGEVIPDFTYDETSWRLDFHMPIHDTEGVDGEEVEETDEDGNTVTVVRGKKDFLARYDCNGNRNYVYERDIDTGNLVRIDNGTSYFFQVDYNNELGRLVLSIDDQHIVFSTISFEYSGRSRTDHCSIFSRRQRHSEIERSLCMDQYPYVFSDATALRNVNYKNFTGAETVRNLSRNHNSTGYDRYKDGSRSHEKSSIFALDYSRTYDPFPGGDISKYCNLYYINRDSTEFLPNRFYIHDGKHYLYVPYFQYFLEVPNVS